LLLGEIAIRHAQQFVKGEPISLELCELFVKQSDRRFC